MDFARKSIFREMVQGKNIIEFGSSNYNGTVKTHVMKYNPASYLGCDVQDGVDVDKICDVLNALDEFEPYSFDMVISTEMLEHIERWGKAVWNMKMLVKPGGYILLTTRSKGFYYHSEYGCEDYWRFSANVLILAFSDFEIINAETDPVECGAYIFARRLSDDRTVSQPEPVDKSITLQMMLHDKGIKLNNR
jgi:SAM-dependent methyltransferase